MRDTVIYSAQFLVIVLPVLAAVRFAKWISDQMMVGSSDPICHPFIFLGPIGLLLGSGCAFVLSMIVSEYHARRKRIDGERRHPSTDLDAAVETENQAEIDAESNRNEPNNEREIGPET